MFCSINCIFRVILCPCVKSCFVLAVAAHCPLSRRPIVPGGGRWRRFQLSRELLQTAAQVAVPCCGHAWGAVPARGPPRRRPCVLALSVGAGALPPGQRAVVRASPVSRVRNGATAELLLLLLRVKPRFVLSELFISYTYFSARILAFSFFH